MGHIKEKHLNIFIGIFVAFIGAMLFASSASAASYLNVSSGGDGTSGPNMVSFGKLYPSSSGSLSTGSDTLTIHTDCSAGYKVYVSGQNEKSTNLINNNAENSESPTSSEIISPSAATLGTTPTALSPNTWGISGNTTDFSNRLFYGLPSYEDGAAHPLVTNSNVPEETKVPVFYGVNVNADLSPGSYTGDVLYTVLMDDSCTSYTITFSPNVNSSSTSEISGTMENQVVPVGETTSIRANNYTRTGYTFLGWSTSASGKTGSVINGVGTMEDVDYDDASEITDIASAGSTIVLYAIWTRADVAMQSWNGCSSLSVNQIVYLTDSRDDRTYAVKKAPDGKCWMLENLTISGTGLKVPSLNNDNTNIPDTDNNNYYLPPRNKRYSVEQSITNPNVLTAEDSAFFGSGASIGGPSDPTDYSSFPQVAYMSQDSESNASDDTVPEDTAYYNFYTASLGFLHGGNNTTTSGSSPRDICPKGWHLPWASDSGDIIDGNAELYTLGLAYNNNPSAWTNYIAPGDTSTSEPESSDAAITQNLVSYGSSSLDRFQSNGAVGFTASGSFEAGSHFGAGTWGEYWTSSASSSGTAYILSITNFSDISISPSADSGIIYGLAARCVVNNYTIAFDANGGTGTMDNQVVFGNNTTTQTIKTNTFTRTGYHFLGWSTDSSATSATYTDGQALTTAIAENGRTIKLYAIWAPNSFTINYNSNGGSGTTNPTTATYGTNVTLATNSFTAPSGRKFKSWGTTTSGGTTYSSGQSGIAPTTLKPDITTTNGGSITLYAIWENDYKYFQTANICSLLAIDATTVLRDNRDNQSYTVYRFGSSAPSGMANYCLMTKDMSLGYVTGGSVTKGANLTLTTDNSAAAGTITGRTGTSDWSTTNADSNLQYINGTGGTYDSHSYYSYGAAQKVCPKGWRLPTYTEYENIITFMGGDNSTGISTITSTPYKFTYGGYFYSGGWYDTGSYGRYWTSSQIDNTEGVSLYFFESYLYADGDKKHHGVPVRCISS